MAATTDRDDLTLADHPKHGELYRGIPAREYQVLLATLRGLTVKETAARMFLGIETVKTHRRRAIAHMGCTGTPGRTGEGSRRRFGWPAAEGSWSAAKSSTWTTWTRARPRADDPLRETTPTGRSRGEGDHTARARTRAFRSNDRGGRSRRRGLVSTTVGCRSPQL